jgi:glycerophosphoryl diester phosphodiesterase
VNDAADVERIKALGVDMAMTDWPERFVAQYG